MKCTPSLVFDTSEPFWPLCQVMYAVPDWSTVTCGSFWPLVLSAASARAAAVKPGFGGGGAALVDAASGAPATSAAQVHARRTSSERR